MTLDDAGEALIKSFEALRLNPYLDIAGKWTIGWGHTSGVSEKTPPISEAEAEFFFHQDTGYAARVLEKYVRIDLTQSEFNSLVSFVFNEGEARFHNSTLLIRLNLGDIQGAAKEFDKWVYYHDKKTGETRISRDLVGRRAKEKTLFLADFHSLRSTAGE